MKAIVDEMAMGVMGSRTAVRWATVLLIIAGAATVALTGYLCWHWLVSLVLAMSVLTLVIYGYDKRSARQGGPRVPERVLHMMALLGGAPGAWAGQQFFRHKTAKTRFKIVFWLICMIQVGLVGAYFGGWL